MNLRELLLRGLISLAMLLGGPLLIVIGGALIGHVSAWAMPETFKMWQAYFGVGAFVPWQIGAGLGFIGSFFRRVA